jgi:hypothetical protein
MKQRFVLWLLLGISLTSLQAQNTLFVKENSGVQTPYSLASINKLTFASGNIVVNKNDGNANSYSLTNIRNLTFGKEGTTNISPIDIEKNYTLMLYPNPVIDQLHVQYVSAMSENVQLQIVDMQGKIILQQSIDNQPGINHATIPVSQLQHGLYLCRLQNGTKLKTIKFLKN